MVMISTGMRVEMPEKLRLLRGDRLKAMRARKNYTVRDMAEFLHVSPPSYSQWENSADPSIQRLREICRILDCSADYLLGLVDDPNQHVELSALPPDEQNLLVLYRQNRLPRMIKKLLGEFDIGEDNDKQPLIESGSKSTVASQKKAANS